ncbi:MAG: hypothetical protein ACHP7I_06530 [Terriglobales bacterium]
MQNSDPVLTKHYLEKSDHFFDAMKLTADDMSSYWSAVGLLAVHSCISLNDAITVAVTGKPNKNQDHGKAADDLDAICGAVKVRDRRGVGHLRWLLSRKTDIAYGSKRLDSETITSARDKAERFYAWAYNNFREVLRATTDK